MIKGKETVKQDMEKVNRAKGVVSLHVATPLNAPLSKGYTGATYV